LEFEPEIGPDLGGLAEWPLEQVVKVLCFCHPDDDDEMWAAQEEAIVRIASAARRNRLDLLLEVIPSKVGPVADDTVSRIIERVYGLGVYPDWWKLEPMVSTAAWNAATAAIAKADPHCRGIVVLGLGVGEADLARSFEVAAGYPLVKGFAVGRTIFADPAKEWFAGRMSDDDAVTRMAESYGRLCEIWDAARARGKEAV
jgi:5-dehydro-2-deoxygluconokinase